MISTVELVELELICDLGTYHSNDVLPSAHLLDLTLSISPELVLNNNDEMSHVFDYDPLITEIEQLAGDGHYETQERLLTRIVHACANRPQVIAIEIYLRKKPVTFLGGTLGIRLKLDTKDLFKIRKNFSNNS
ncbi:MAG: hypothetical protein CMF71_06905 [Magnetovibrio sp.]|nr:hypothetical protein [Magnetovibrio sp.]